MFRVYETDIIAPPVLISEHETFEAADEAAKNHAKRFAQSGDRVVELPRQTRMLAHYGVQDPYYELLDYGAAVVEV